MMGFDLVREEKIVETWWNLSFSLPACLHFTICWNWGLLGEELTLEGSTNWHLGLSKLKACADDKLDINPNMNFVFHRVENIMEKLGNACYKSFSPFSSVFL